MDKLKILYLITLEAIGCISIKDSSELSKAMQSEKNFPWKEMGEYQNLAAILSMVINQESPAKHLKDLILNEIEKIEKRKPELGIKSDLSIKQDCNSAVRKEKGTEINDIPDDKLEQVDIKKHELKIVDHSNEFEEVKAKLFKIKDQQKKTPDPGHQLLAEVIEEIPFVKSKKKKSTNEFFHKGFVIAASLAFVVIVLSTLFFLNFFNDDIVEQKKLAVKETEMLISKSRIVPNEQEPVVALQNTEQVEPQNNLPDKLKLQEESDQSEVPPKMIEQIKEHELQKPNLPPPQTPDFIEAPLVIEETEDNSELDNDQLTTATLKKQLPPKEEIVVNEEPVYFVAVEEMPEPIGGISGIQKRIVYPELAKRAGIDGRVLVLAFVDESGNVTKAEVIKGIGLGCDEAAINAILQTKFKPGKQRGKPVKVKVTIPVTFKLK
jgi:protein TonB